MTKGFLDQKLTLQVKNGQNIKKKKKWRKITDSWCRRQGKKTKTMDMFPENLQDRRLSKLLLPSSASDHGDLAELLKRSSGWDDST